MRSSHRPLLLIRSRSGQAIRTINVRPLALIPLISALLVFSGCDRDSWISHRDPSTADSDAGQPLGVSDAAASRTSTVVDPWAEQRNREKAIQIRESLTGLSEKGKAAYRILACSRCFAPGLVGAGASMPREIPAFRDLLKEPLADTAFKSLYETSGRETHLWALCGLYYTDHAFFVREANGLAFSRAIVETQWGCIVLHEPMGEVISSRDENVVRLKDNKETLEDWQNRNPDWRTRGVAYDILGGAYPELLRTFPCDHYADRVLGP